MNGGKGSVHEKLKQITDSELEHNYTKHEKLPLKIFQTTWFKELRTLLAKELFLFILLISYNFWFVLWAKVENK